jgi:predicted Zn-dependent protease
VYVVSGGEVIGSCTNFRFNDSPVDLLGRTLAVGRSAPTLAREFGEWPGSTLMPPLLVDSFHLTGSSDAV